MVESPELTFPVSPVAGWTPAPDDSTPEGLRTVLGAPSGSSNGIHGSAGVPPLPLRATSGTAASPPKAASRASLNAPFNERDRRGSSSAHPTTDTGNGSKARSKKQALQPSMSHDKAIKRDLAAPPGKVPTQLVKASTCYGGASTRSVTAEAQHNGQQFSRTGNRGQSSSNVSSRPASHRAAASVAAAEAAVSAAAAVLQPGKEAAAGAATMPAAPQPPQAGSVAAISQQLLNSGRHCSPFAWPAKGSPKDKHDNSSSKGSPEPSCLNNSTLSQQMLSDSLQVHGVPPDLKSSQHAASQGDSASTCGDLSPDAAGQQAANSSKAAVTRQVVSDARTAALQHQSATDLCYKQLMLQRKPVPPQTAAEIMAAKAKSRRIRIQQQALHGQRSFLRRAIQRRPGSPPPVVLDGSMLLSSCPGSIGPSDVLSAELNACGISSVPMSQYSETAVAEPLAALAASEATVAPDSESCEETSSSPDGGHNSRAEAAEPQTAAPVNAAAIVAVDADQAAGEDEVSSPGMADAASWQAATSTGPSLQEFTQLCSLCLSDNRLSCIAGLVRLPALQQLAVSANRLRGLQGLAQALSTDVANKSTATQQFQQQQQHQQQAGIPQDPSSGQCSTSGSNGSNQQASTISGQQQHNEHRQQQNSESSTQGYTAGVSLLTELQPVMYCPGRFGCLRELDLSFNIIPGDQLLGEQSPLAHLPRLCILHAAGNSLASLPGVLGPFASLSYLDLSHNRLGSTALVPLGQLQALQQLLLSHNPIRKAVDGLYACTTGGNAVNSNSTNSAVSSAWQAYKQLTQLDLSYTKVAAANQLLPLLQLRQLAVLQLVGTSLAARCWSGRDPLQELEKPGLCIVTHEHEPQSLWHHSSEAPPALKKSRQRKQQGKASCSTERNAGRFLPVTVEDAAQAGHVLSAAGKSAVLGLQHEQLVAAFERVDRGIETWQLTPVAEESEGSASWEEGSDEALGQQLQEQQHNQNGGHRQQLATEDEEPVVDQTFITGVGITADLPADDEEPPCSIHPADDEPQNPTERLAVALGLQVCQLAHYTHKQPNNPVAAVHKLRHALAHPLVDADVGQRPPQNHTSMTAATAAKQRPRQLLPLLQPIPTTLDTRVKPVQSIESVLSGMRHRLQALEGTLLQQLQAQSIKLSIAAQSMHSNAAEEPSKTSS